MDMICNIVLIVIGFILLMKGADFFVDGAASVATRMGIPQIVVGLTIVAFGTSAPEAAISISAALSQEEPKKKKKHLFRFFLIYIHKLLLHKALILHEWD